VTNILKYLFPVPKDDSKRVMTYANVDDYISFRHHVYEKHGKEIKLKEVGPRFEMRLYQIKLGTVDQKEVENEWSLRSFMRTAKTRVLL
jgi:U3 small nucleolar ribonucleoprotein protein IMP4